MTKCRLQQIEFIIQDIEKRGEKIITDITFFACIYSLKIEVNNKTKKVKYKSGDTLKGYRLINLTLKTSNTSIQ